MNWSALWKIADVVWTLVAYIFVASATYRKEWSEATMWLAFLILNRMPAKERT